MLINLHFWTYLPAGLIIFSKVNFPSGKRSRTVRPRNRSCCRRVRLDFYFNVLVNSRRSTFYQQLDQIDPVLIPPAFSVDP